ncbi:hypothetical protein [Tomitella gaofuii]|uniref:hypothetical protein n=1 Tax=Tomitella gaofuii TaxID=2760083 RepID=UPI0015FE54B5|nr:hypothetical protein [Tomitella gaofuii]
MKKTLTLFALIGVLATGAACSSGDSGTRPTTTPAVTSTTTSAPTTTPAPTSAAVNGRQSHAPGAVSNTPQKQRHPASGGAVMPNPNGDGSTVPCEGTICTNPNHGAGAGAN